MRVTEMNTPGFMGYLAMFGISLVVASGLLAAMLAMSALPSATSVGDAAAIVFECLTWWILFGVFGLYFAVPTALVATPLVHLLCRGLRAQWIHVVATGVIAFVVLVIESRVLLGDPTGAHLGLVDDIDAVGFIGLAAAVGAAAGRAAVIVVVRRRRLSAGASRPQPLAVVRPPTP